jgi:hypothetical protein
VPWLSLFFFRGGNPPDCLLGSVGPSWRRFGAFAHSLFSLANANEVRAKRAPGVWGDGLGLRMVGMANFRDKNVYKVNGNGSLRRPVIDLPGGSSPRPPFSRFVRRVVNRITNLFYSFSSINNSAMPALAPLFYFVFSSMTR